MADAMSYEMTIRKIFNCGRFAHGANTDTYTRLQKDYAYYAASKKGDKSLGVMTLTKELDEYALKYGYTCGEVAGYLRLALKHLIDHLSNDDKHDHLVEELSELEGKLFNARFADINKVIDRTDEILTELKMYPG